LQIKNNAMFILPDFAIGAKDFKNSVPLSKIALPTKPEGPPSYLERWPHFAGNAFAPIDAGHLHKMIKQGSQ
jgi:hypothetical protein